MNAEIQGYIRAFLASVSGGLVTSGVLTVDQFAMYTQYASGLILLAGVVLWSKASNSIPMMISQVAASPNVQKIITTAAIANADPSSKVVSQ